MPEDVHAMSTVLKTLGCGALALTIMPPLLFLTKALTEPAMKSLMLFGCALWFVVGTVFHERRPWVNW